MVHSVSPWGSLGSSGVVGFTRVRLGGLLLFRGRRVHSASFLGSLGSSGVAGFTPVGPAGLWVRPGSLGSL